MKLLNLFLITFLLLLSCSRNLSGEQLGKETPNEIIASLSSNVYTILKIKNDNFAFYQHLIQNGINNDIDIEKCDTLILSLLNEELPPIKSLDGIQYFKNLKNLEISNHEISDIDSIEKLDYLESLSLPDNFVSDIRALRRLNTLKYLNLANNDIEDISDLRSLSNLQSLNLNHNKIKEVDHLKTLKELSTLLVSQNKITKIKPLNGLLNLKVWDATQNPLEDIENLSFKLNYIKSNNPILYKNIRTLNIKSDVEIDKVEVLNFDLAQANMFILKSLLGLQHFVNLKALLIKGHEVADFKILEGLKSLEFLDISDVPLSDLKFTEKLPNIRQIQHNNRKFEEVNTTILSKIKEANPVLYREILKTNCRTNSQIKSCEELDFNSITDLSTLEGLQYFEGLKFFRILYSPLLKDCSVLSNLLNLEGLSIESSGINSLSFLENLSKLKFLSLNNNYGLLGNIKSIEYLKNLEILSLNNCGVESILSLKELNNLKEVYLEKNNINDLSPLLNKTSIHKFFASNNNIINILPLATLPQITEIALSGNNISNFDCLKPLKNLKLFSHHEITLFDIHNPKQYSIRVNNFAFSTFLKRNNIKTDLDIFNTKSMNLNNLLDFDSLFGFEYFVNLESLSLGNECNLICFIISDMNFLATFKNLKRLWLNTCIFSSIDCLSELKNLESLRILNNHKLTKFNFSDLGSSEKLKVLEISTCRLESIKGIEKLKNLECLYLQNNFIKSISSLGELRKVKSLNLSKNKIKDISALSSLSNLSNLFLPFNKISKLDALIELSRLKVLKVKYNNVLHWNKVKTAQKLPSGVVVDSETIKRSLKG